MDNLFAEIKAISTPDKKPIRRIEISIDKIAIQSIR
jgi:hypothetical protein